MALLVFAVLAIVGVMPSGLSNLQAAERREAEARIYQTLAADYQSKSWLSVKALTRSSVLYFDRTGLALNTLNDEVAYAAMVKREATPLLLPGEANPSPYLVHLTIAISNRPREPSVLNAQHKDNSMRREYGLVIVNQEPDSQ